MQRPKAGLGAMFRKETEGQYCLSIKGKGGVMADFMCQQGGCLGMINI